MALIKCPECNQKISDMAPACIHCGFPFSRSFSKPKPEDNIDRLDVHREHLADDVNVNNKVEISETRHNTDSDNAVLSVEEYFNLTVPSESGRRLINNLALSASSIILISLFFSSKKIFVVTIVVSFVILLLYVFVSFTKRLFKWIVKTFRFLKDFLE
jgi:hypothetical protein